MAKVLITGATGFIGSHLTRDFLKQKHEVHLITRPKSPLWRLKDTISKVTRHSLDLRHADSVTRLLKRLKPDIILHTAAAGIYRNRHLPAKQMLQHNTLATVNLLTASSTIPYRAFIHTGSSSEYGPKNTPMKESDTCVPQDMYAISKLAATHCAQLTARRANKPIVVLRLFSPYGPQDDPRRLIPYVITQARHHHPLKLASPTAVRDYIYIKDVVTAYRRAVQSASQYAGEIFNVGSGREVATQVVVKTVLEVCRSRSPVNWGKIKPSSQDTAHWRASITKAKKLLHWHPQYDLRRGLKATIDGNKKGHV